MFSKQDFDNAYDVVWWLRFAINTMVGNKSIEFDLANALRKMGHSIEGVDDIKGSLELLCRRDVLSCYFSLDYPTVYLNGEFDDFDLLCYVFSVDNEWITYDDYYNYITNPAAVNLNNRMFELLKQIALEDKQSLRLLSILNEASPSNANIYIENLQKLAERLFQKAPCLTEQGRKWYDTMRDNPMSLATFQGKEDFKLKADELIVETVEREYYNLIDKITDELWRFVSANQDVSRALSKAIKQHPFLGLIVDEVGLVTMIKIFVTKDLCECYKKLNHSININTIEGKVLFMFILKTINQRPNYDNFKAICDPTSSNSDIQEIRSICINVIHKLYEFDDKVEENFKIPFFLKNIDGDLYNQYMVIVYRCASVIAKADGTINELESQWLSQLVSITGGINEEKVLRYDLDENSNSPLDELQSLIGLDSVKKEVVSLANFIKMRQMREAKGLKAPGISYHCVFTGNPGTGKTSVARILAGIFKELGVLKSGHLVETDRSGLVAEYVGQTAVKTNKIIDSALDGVLFVDEAYTLVGGQNDYGKEAITTLLKRMEDDRERLIVILAGYTNEMEEFINSNPGLRSRFNRFIDFPDYSAEELFDIFKINTIKNEYVLTDEAVQYLKLRLGEAINNKKKDFGNARFVRNYFELAIEHQANRLSTEVDLTADKLSELTLEDVSVC